MSLIRLRAKARRVIRRDRAATDPILVIAAIAVSLVLLIGGSFAVGGMISNAKNLNAQSDLDKVSTAEAAWSANGASTANYIPYISGNSTPNLNFNLAATGGTNVANALEQSGVGFTPTSGDRVAVTTDATGASWAAVSKSSTGAIYIRTSTSSAVGALTGTPGSYVLPANVTLPASISLANLNSALTTATGF